MSFRATHRGQTDAVSKTASVFLPRHHKRQNISIDRALAILALAARKLQPNFYLARADWDYAILFG